MSYSLFVILVLVWIIHWSSPGRWEISQFRFALILNFSLSFFFALTSLILKAFLNHQREIKKRCYIRKDNEIKR
jgi:hypothetical protein